MNAPSESSTAASDTPTPLPVIARSVLDAMTDAAVIFDAELRMLYRNPPADVLLADGPTIDVVLNATPGAPRNIGWSAELRNALQSDETLRYDAEPGADQPHAIELTVAPLASDSPDASRCGLLTARRRISADTARPNSRAGDAPLNTDRFQARVAHELNNPLDGVLRYINLTIRSMGATAPPEIADYLGRSRTGLMQMARIVSEMLTDHGNGDPRPHAISINQVVEDAVRTFEHRATQSGVVVTESYRHENMPSVHSVKLYQVCCNLIKNALDAMPDGGMLTVNTGVAGDAVVLRFEDTGVGLPDDVGMVFRPRYTTKTEMGGVGLGLAMCKEFIEQLGGTIAAADREGGGAVFTINIPLEKCSGEFAHPLRAATAPVGRPANREERPQ